MSDQKSTPPWHLSAPASQGLFRWIWELSSTYLLIRSVFTCWKDMVEDEAPLKQVMEDFHKWLLSQDLLNKEFAVVTCGDWDLKELLPRQFLHTGQVIPAYFKSWINIKMVRNFFDVQLTRWEIKKWWYLFRYSPSPLEFTPVIYLTCCPTPIWSIRADYTVELVSRK